MEIDITTIEACNIIALCETTGRLTDHKEKFDHIAIKIKKSLGID